MRRSSMFRPGERIGIAVSGGPDSMLLLDFAVAYGAEAGIAVSAVHFNHHLRAAESEGDEDFVRQRARQLGIEIHCSGADVAALARAQKRNLEAVARDLRYRYFFTLVRQGKLDKVATAHTANDQAETVLLRIVRGAGTRGLGAIHPVLDGGVVRPFLMMTRAEVEAEVGLRGLAHRVDASNFESRFTRNRLRQRVLPLLEREFNPHVVESLAGFADRARDDEAFLEEHARERALPWLRHEGAALRIPARRLVDFPPAIARRVLRRMVAVSLHAARGSTGPVAISYAEMEDLRRLAEDGQGGKRITLAAGVEVRKEFEWLVVSPARPDARGDPAAQGPGFSYPVCPPATILIPELGIRLGFGFADVPDADEPQAEYTKGEAVWLDPSNPASPLTLRSWRAGDRFHALGKTNPVKLKELFQRRGMPVSQRLWWPLLECAGTIIWVRGFPGARAPGKQSGRQLLIREGHIPSPPALRG
jgi:tRNA(Ile)-lysidine synthase